MTVPEPSAVPPEGSRGNGATGLSAEPLRLSAEAAQATGGSGFPALSAQPARGGGPFNLSELSEPDGILDRMRRRVVSPVFVGRAGEISRLRSAFAAVREGTPAAVLIGGEAGVGKSRLTGEFTAAERYSGAQETGSRDRGSRDRGTRDTGPRDAGPRDTGPRDTGPRVLIGGCLELGADGLPFAPFTAVLRDLVRELGVEAIAGMLAGRAIRELARLLPELGEAPTGV